MLEDWAWRYIALSEVQVQLASLGVMVLGGIVAALFHRGRRVLNRAQYFALSGLVVLGIALAQAIWLLAPAAMRGGWLSGLVLLEGVVSFTAGYVLVTQGQARSRDAFGHGKAGIAGIVPVANLWLLFAPGKMPSEAMTGFAVFRGGSGVVLGLVALVLSRLVLAQLLPVIESRVIAAGEDPALTARFVEVRMSQVSAPGMLREMAAGAEVPQDLGNGVSLMEVRAEGLVLTYVYHLTDPEAELNYDYADVARGAVCEDPVFLRLVSEGARVEFRYLGLNRGGGMAEIGAVSVASVDCGV